MVQRITDAVAAWWPVLVAVFLTASAWGGTAVQIANVQAQQTKIEAKQDQLLERLARIGEGIAGDHARIDGATGAIAELRTRIYAVESRR